MSALLDKMELITVLGLYDSSEYLQVRTMLFSSRDWCYSTESTELVLDCRGAAPFVLVVRTRKLHDMVASPVHEFQHEIPHSQ